MKKLLLTFACSITLCIPAALAQVPHATPAPSPRDDHQSGLPNKPDQQSTTAQAPPGTLADTQQRVQDELEREMPAGHGRDVKVSVTDDGSVELTGRVDTDYQKRRAEDIARSATSNQSIINKIEVSGKEPLSNQTTVPK